MLWRIANAFAPNHPINFERVLGSSYNTRSALEALLAHTPEFYTCLPGRIELPSQEIKRGHKHIVWLPNKPHGPGVMRAHDVDMVISEVPSTEAVYEALTLPELQHRSDPIDIEIQRRHAQIQIALVLIGKQLGYDIWVAQNDKGIVYNGKRLGEFDGVIGRLEGQKILSAYPEAARAGLLIDCIWFRDGKRIPAVIEIEHSTGVTSGLTRMNRFRGELPALQGIQWIVVAPDEIRQKVLQEANDQQFADLDVRFLPYSAVEELYSLCQRRKIYGVSDQFIECFTEKCKQ